MKTFWFYCDEEDSVEFPESDVMFGCEPDKDEMLAKMGGWPTSWGSQLSEEDKLKFKIRQNMYNEIQEEFLNIVGELNESYDSEFIKAKSIPIIRKKLLELGWKEDYIPFGP